MRLFLISCCAAAANASWTYSDTNWINENSNCGAAVPMQSPINIDTTNPEATTAPLVFQGVPDSATTPEIKQQLVINSHTWEVEWDIDDMAETKYGVVYNNKIFRLKQFHFHSPSEHTLDGQHTDLEAHMVHECFGELTCDREGELLVIAIFMNVGDVNPYLASFWPQLETLAAGPSSGPSIIHDMANPYNSLVPPQPHDFYRYVGSTTTPQCVQNVEWFLMSTPVTLSQAQLTSYRTAITNHANTQVATSPAVPDGVTVGWDVTLGTNNRPLQDVGNRVPQKYTSPLEIAEQRTNDLMNGVLIFVGLVALALCALAAFVYATKPKDKKPPKKRGVQPKKAPPAEEVPLVPAPPAPVPMLFTQPMQVPMTYSSPVQLQAPQFQLQQSLVAPQVRPLMVAP